MSESPASELAFSPDALAKLQTTFDDIWTELTHEGIFRDSDKEKIRTRLAKKVLTFPSANWTEAQMRELLVREFRNEAARIERAKDLESSNGR
jgi:hypothetical protein